MGDLKLQNVFASNSSVNLDTKYNNLIASLYIPQTLKSNEKIERKLNQSNF